MKKTFLGEKKMSDEKYGIKETLDAVEFVVELANAVDKAGQDGFQIIDGIHLVPALTKLPAAITGGNEIPAEIDDLNDIERQQLIDKIVELDFVDDRAEKIAEKALATVLALGELLAAIKTSKN